MAKTPVMAKAPSTLAQYGQIAQRLEKMWRRETGIVAEEVGVSEMPMDFCRWFDKSARETRWAKNTFWLYRQALVTHFEKQGPNEAVVFLHTIPSPPKSTDRNTSAKKMKRLSGDYLSQLLSRLEMHPEIPPVKNTGSKAEPGSLDHFIARWLRTALTTGLRPTEWRDAFFDDGKNALVVRNAKHSEVRSNGYSRHIIFDPDEHAREIQEIKLFLDELHIRVECERSFDLLYFKCRKRLGYVTRRLWPKAEQRPTIYSARHQFAANMKKSGLTKQEVAALMGHKNDDSACVHYARTQVGQSVNTPSSPKAEIDSVVHKESSFNPALQKKQ